MFLDHFIQILMDIPDHFIITVHSECIGDDRLERLFLITGSYRHSRSENIADKFFMDFLRLLRIVEDIMDIGCPVDKCREQETDIRNIHDPVTDTVLDQICLRIVAKTCLREFYRTDTAHDVLINLIRCIKHFCTVGRLSGDIIYSMDQDDVVVFGIIIVFNDLIVETFYQCIIGQFAFSQFHKKMLSSTLSFLLERKFHVHQIFSYCSGKGFAENFKVFEHFFF